MQTKQAIQTTANVIRITNVQVGDVYKRYDTSYDDRVYYGVVRHVNNDGENAIIEATEYRYSYSSLDVDYKIIKGDKDIAIFPATPEELNLELEKARKTKVREIEEAEEKIAKNKKLIQEIDKLASGETLKTLKAMSYSELTQEQFNERKKALLGA